MAASQQKSPPQSTALTPEQSRNEDLRKILTSRKATIADLIPPNQKDNAEYFITRALFYFKRKKELWSCSPGSFVACVLQAAEYGLPLDGRLAHAVVFNTKVSRKGEPDRWEEVATFMPDYKGLVVVGKRVGQIRDADADLVCEADTFTLSRDDQGQHIHYVPALENRGRIIGAFCSIQLPDGTWKHEYMEKKDIDHVRGKSKAKDNGPWVTDYGEMAKKTVIKRAMKLETQDPLFERLIEHDNREYIDDETERKPAPKSLNSLADTVLGQEEVAALPAPTEPDFSVPSEIQEEPREPVPAAKKQSKGKQQRQAGPATGQSQPAQTSSHHQSLQEGPAAASSTETEEEPPVEGEIVGGLAPHGWADRTAGFIAESEDFQAARRAYDEACGPERKYELTEDEHEKVTNAWTARQQIETDRAKRNAQSRRGGQGRLVD